MIRELKEKSAIIMRSETGKPLKLPLIRGGDFVLAKGFALYHIIIKNKKFANLVWAIVKAKRNQNRLMLVRYFFIILDKVLRKSVGLIFTVDKSYDYIQIFMLTFPATIGGFLVGATTACISLSDCFAPISLLIWSWY